MSITSTAARGITKGKATNFTGDVYLDTLTQAEGKSLLGATYVTFCPGARSVWHLHSNRQVLVVTAGWGVLQIEGQPAQRLECGDVAVIPPEIVHLHGASTNSTLTHLALLEAEGDGTTWKHAVDEHEYRAAGENLKAR